MAAEAFSEIIARGKITALCFDIENFFPSIQHNCLKDGLLQLLGGTQLPDDWYQVYRSLIKYAWIELDEFGPLEGFDPKAPPFPLVTDINAALDRCRAGKIIHKHRGPCGIPQGTPLSAMAANISMISFDSQLLSYIQSVGGYYRRYSDDILILVPPTEEANATIITTRIANSCGLTISSLKTEVSRFQTINGTQSSDRPISYLGFCFDGARTFLRASTLSRYYRRMTYATRGAVRGSVKKGALAADTFKRTLYKDFTHLGRRNFYSYSRRADRKMPNSIIKKQLKRHFEILLRKLLARGR